MSALLVGLNNPLSDRPSDALVPWPAGCTGARLLDLIVEAAPDFTADDYLAAFERRNLWPGQSMPAGYGAAAALRAEGRSILKSILHGPKARTVVLLGTRVWLNVLETTVTPQWFSSQNHYGRSFVYLPHPSGRNLLLHNPGIRRRTSRTLATIALEELDRCRSTIASY
jgi:uracil-DNA glycosylase